MPIVYEQQNPSPDPTVYPERPLTSRLVVPPVGGSEAALLTAVNEIVQPQAQWSALRRRALVRGARNLRMVDGDHWLEVLEDALRAGANGYQMGHVTRPGSTACYPTPVDNKLAPGVINELSRLTRREYVPQIEALRGLPRIQNAALAAKQYLQWSLRQQHWDDVRFAHARETFVCGTSALRAWWDSPTGSWAWAPFPTARRCQACGAMLAEPGLGPEDAFRRALEGPDSPRIVRESLIVAEMPVGTEGPELGSLSDLADLAHLALDVPGAAPEEVEPGPRSMRLDNPDLCPFCEAGQMAPIMESDRWAMDMTDVLGRPLGDVEPRGVARLEHVSMFGLYPDNDGLSDPWEQVRYGARQIRDVDWLCERYPQCSARLDPQSPTELRRYHPVIGDANTYWGSSDYTEKSYRNHREEVEAIIEPCRAHPDGRRIVKSGDVVLADEPLQTWHDFELPGHKGTVRRAIRHVTYGFTRFWTIAPHYFWGTTPLNDAVKLNWRLNELDAQWVDTRERGGPMIVIPAGVQIERSGDEGGYRVVEVTGPLGTSAKDLLAPGQPQTGNVYAPERQVVENSIKEALGPHEVEAGDNPTGVNTATQLMILNEEAAKRREPAERSFIGTYEAVWSTLVSLTWAFHTWEDDYEAETAQGRAELKRFKGADFAGQTVVKVTKEAGVDHSLYEAQATKDGLESGLIAPDDPVKAYEIARAMKIPANLNEGVSLQVKRAQEDWQEFASTGQIPVIDPTMHDARVRFGVLGRAWEGDEGAEMQREAGWPQILRSIHGWEDKLAEADKYEASLKQAYGAAATPESMEAAHQEALAKATVAVAAQRAMEQGRSVQELGPQDIEQAEPMAEQQAGLPKPPGPGFEWLPGPLEERIYVILSRLAAVPKMEVPEGAGPEEIPEGAEKAQLQDSMLRMYSVLQAYRRMALPQESAPMPAPPDGSGSGGGATGAPAGAAPVAG